MEDYGTVLCDSRDIGAFFWPLVDGLSPGDFPDEPILWTTSMDYRPWTRSIGATIYDNDFILLVRRRLWDAQRRKSSKI